MLEAHLSEPSAATSAEPVLRSELALCQLLPPNPADPPASTGDPTGLLMGENLQLCDREAGAVMLC